MSRFVGRHYNSTAIRGESLRHNVLDSRYLQFCYFPSSGGNEPAVTRVGLGDRKHPLLIRRERDSIAFAQAHRRGAVGLPKEYCPQRSSALSAFVKHYFFAVRGHVDQHCPVEPGEFSI